MKKIKKRLTDKRIQTQRITSPEFRKNGQGQKIPLLSYVDDRNDHKSLPVTRELFLYAAGENEQGSLPDGLDRLMDHVFVIHVDKAGTAIGLDVIPARVYRSKVIPKSQEGVETIKVTWELDGAVCRVIQRPAGVTSKPLVDLVRALDDIISSGQPITATTKLPKGKIVSVDGEVVEVRLTIKGKGGSIYEDALDE